MLVRALDPPKIPMHLGLPSRSAKAIVIVRAVRAVPLEPVAELNPLHPHHARQHSLAGVELYAGLVAR